MFGSWYNSSFRRYIVMMGDLFSHVQVARQRDDGIKHITVPISYASKERFEQKMNKITSINSEENIAKIETILPRMNLHMVDVMYNSQYKTSIQTRTQAQHAANNALKMVSQYNPTPVKMIFELGIYTRHQDDMFQIVEQILPYFQPHFVTTMDELHGNDVKLPEKRDIRITLQSVSVDENLDTDNLTRRRLEWSIIFEVNGWIYPPIADIAGEIRTIYLDFFANAKELTTTGNFESIDSEVVPRDTDHVSWDKDKKYIQTESENIPIPKDPIPPGPRG